MMALAGTIARLTGRHGAAYTLLRKVQANDPAQPWKAGTETLTFDVVQARERGYRAIELRGGIQEGDVLIVVDAGTCAVRPVAGDRIALGAFSTEEGGASFYSWEFLSVSFTFDDNTQFFDSDTEPEGSGDGAPEWRQVVAVNEARNSGVVHAYRLQARR